jgi:hypothetical protein
MFRDFDRWFRIKWKMIEFEKEYRRARELSAGIKQTGLREEVSEERIRQPWSELVYADGVPGGGLSRTCPYPE